MTKRKILIGLALLGLTAVALAASGTPVPGLGDLDPDWRAWFTNPAALAGTVAVFTAYLKTWLKLEGDATRLVGLAVGIVMSFVGNAVGEVQGGFLQTLLFGITAGIAAGGGWDIAAGIATIFAKIFGIQMASGADRPSALRTKRVVEVDVIKEDEA